MACICKKSIRNSRFIQESRILLNRYVIECSYWVLIISAGYWVLTSIDVKLLNSAQPSVFFYPSDLFPPINSKLNTSVEQATRKQQLAFWCQLFFILN